MYAEVRRGVGGLAGVSVSGMSSRHRFGNRCNCMKGEGHTRAATQQKIVVRGELPHWHLRQTLS